MYGQHCMAHMLPIDENRTYLTNAFYLSSYSLNTYPSND